MWGHDQTRDRSENRGQAPGWGEDRSAVAAQAPKPRVVQYRGRRYSIRLETVFWKYLEYLAGRRELRLGRYIAGLAAAYDGNNLSSYLRVVCMLEAQRSLAEAALDPARDSLLALVRDCPSPGVIVSRSRTILGYNTAFANWLGPGPRVLAGSELTDVLQIRTSRSLNEIWTDLITGARGTVKAQVLRFTPGRVSVAQATIVPLRSDRGEGFYAVLWLAATPSSGAGKPAESRADRRIG